MDQKEMMERLKRDPAALHAVMGSRDGQMLLGLLSGIDGGRTLQQAIRQAAAGDASAISGWAETAMSWANGSGLINGHDDGTIDPQGTTTRAQAASILMNFDQNVAEN